MGGRFSSASEWLTISPSPRAAALGTAYYGIMKGANSALINPAFPAFIDTRQAQAHYGEMLSGIRYEGLTLVEPLLGIGTLSLITRYYSTGKMAHIRGGVLDGEFENYDLSFTAGYAYLVRNTLGVGANIRFINSALGDYTATGIGGDIGIVRHVDEKTVCGLSLHNISGPLKYRDTAESLPFFVSGGISRSFMMRNENVAMILAFGARYLGPGEIEMGAGLEHTAYEQFSLRAGYDMQTKKNKLTLSAGINAGIGINIQGFMLDYAWVPFGELGTTHRFGLGYRFSGKKRVPMKINISVVPKVFSPKKDKLGISINWGKIKNPKEWEISIMNSYGHDVKTIRGQGLLSNTVWGGRGNNNEFLPDGNYSMRLKVIADRERLYRSNIEKLTIDSTPPEFSIRLSTGRFTPDGNGDNDVLEISVHGSDNNMFDLYILHIFNQSGKKVREYVKEKSSDKIIWNGKDDYYGQVMPEGIYSIVGRASDTAGNVTVLPRQKTNLYIPPKIITKTIKVKEEERGLKINLTSNVLFDTGHSDLKPSSFESLLEVIGLLKAYPDNRVSIEGHSDSVGSAEVNRSLSLKRAEAVRDHLVQRGIETARISVVGWGEEKPIASNRKRNGRAKNRRVEIVILKEKEN